MVSQHGPRTYLCPVAEDGAVRLTGCPECGAPAEVDWAITLASTDGPVQHVKLRCVRRHHFVMACDRSTPR